MFFILVKCEKYLFIDIIPAKTAEREKKA